MKSVALEPIPDKSSCVCHETYKKIGRSDPNCPYCEYDDVFDKWREERARNEVFEQAVTHLVETVNKEGSVLLTTDWGENTLTLFINGKHTHVGVPNGSLKDLADQIVALLRDGRGLSWA